MFSNDLKKEELYYIGYSQLLSIQAYRGDDSFLDEPSFYLYPEKYKGNAEYEDCIFKVKYIGDGIFEEVDTKIQMTAAPFIISNDKILLPNEFRYSKYSHLLDCSPDPQLTGGNIHGVDNFKKVIEYHQKLPIRVDIDKEPRKVSEADETIYKSKNEWDMKPEDQKYWINIVKKEDDELAELYSKYDTVTRTNLLKKIEADCREAFNYSIQRIVLQDYEAAIEQDKQREKAKEEFRKKNEKREQTRKELEKLLGREVPENFQEYIDAHIDLNVALIPLEELKINNIITKKAIDDINIFSHGHGRESSIETLKSDYAGELYESYKRDIKNLGDLLLCDRKRIRYFMQQNKKYIDRLIEYVHSLGCDFLEEKMYPTKPEPDHNLLENCLNVDRNLLNVLNRNNIRTRDELEGIGPAVFYLVGMTDRKREKLKKAMEVNGISFKTDDMKIDSEKFSVLPSKEEMDKLIEENAVIRARITMKEKLMKDYDYLLNERIQLLAREQELDSKLAEVENVNSESEGKTR